MTSQDPKADLSFEETIDNLETIVAKMEQGDLPLEDALNAFEKGIKLARSGEEKLKAAEQKVQILMGTAEDAKLQNFDSSDASD